MKLAIPSRYLADWFNGLVAIISFPRILDSYFGCTRYRRRPVDTDVYSTESNGIYRIEIDWNIAELLLIFSLLPLGRMRLLKVPLG